MARMRELISSKARLGSMGWRRDPLATSALNEFTCRGESESESESESVSDGEDEDEDEDRMWVRHRV